MTKQLIFDGQILQTSAWYRGMGTYNLQLLHQLDELSKDVDLYIVFNDNIDCGKERFDTVSYLCPGVKQIHADLPVTYEKSLSSKSYKRKLSHVLNKLPLGEKYFVITSLFLFDFFAQFPDDCHKIALFYDLTPLLFWHDLGGYFLPHLYMDRFRQIYEADVVLTISETVRQDVLGMLGIDENKVQSINGGFTKPSAKLSRPKEDVPERYVLFVSGNLPHKNNEIAAEGFAAFTQDTNTSTKLLITSNFSNANQEKLKRICPDIIFTGNVSDEELEWLYEHAAAVLFASKYEGLGIPILDAVFNKKPIIASKIPVFEEMSSNAFYFFSPDKSDELAAALKLAIEHDGFASKLKSYAPILKKYSWRNTADDLLQAVESLGNVASVRTTQSDKRVAIVAVNPGIQNQIGRLAEQLYPRLSGTFEVDYYFDSCGLNIAQMERPTFLDYVGPKVADISEFTISKYRAYDEVVYLLDEQCLNYKLAQVAAVLPGIAIHDFGRTQQPGSRLLVKAIMLDNQQIKIRLPVGKYWLDELTKQLILALSSDEKPNERERIIRGRGSNSAIMNRLLSNLHHDE